VSFLISEKSEGRRIGFESALPNDRHHARRRSSHSPGPTHNGIPNAAAAERPESANPCTYPARHGQQYPARRRHSTKCPQDARMPHPPQLPEPASSIQRPTRRRDAYPLTMKSLTLWSASWSVSVNVGLETTLVTSYESLTLVFILRMIMLRLRPYEQNECQNSRYSNEHVA